MSLACSLLGLACQRAGGLADPDRVSASENRGAPRAEEGADASADGGLLRVGTSGDYPPFSEWPGDQPEPHGFSTDVARAWAASAGRRIEWVRFNWSGLASDLTADRFDVAFAGVTIRPDRWQQGRFSLPLATSGAVALVEFQSGILERSELDRPEVGIAVNAGGHLERVARALFPRARLDPIPRNRDVLGQLARDDIDAVLTDTLEAPVWHALQPGLRSIGPLTSDRKAAWFSLTRVTDLQAFDRWLLDAEGNGTLARLRRRYSMPAEATALPGNALLASLDERLSLMIDVAQVKRTLHTPIEDRPREAQVLEAALRSVRDEASRLGVAAPDADAVRRLYRAQIEAAKWLQRNLLGAEPAHESDPTSVAEAATARDRLENEIRPALLFLGDRIATLLVLATTESPRSGHETTFDEAPIRSALTYEATVRALGRHGLPESHLRELHASLLAVGVR